VADSEALPDGELVSDASGRERRERNATLDELGSAASQDAADADVHEPECSSMQVVYTGRSPSGVETSAPLALADAPGFGIGKARWPRSHSAWRGAIQIDLGAIHRVEHLEVEAAGQTYLPDEILIAGSLDAERFVPLARRTWQAAADPSPLGADCRFLRLDLRSNGRTPDTLVQRFRIWGRPVPASTESTSREMGSAVVVRVRTAATRKGLESQRWSLPIPLNRLQAIPAGSGDAPKFLQILAELERLPDAASPTIEGIQLYKRRPDRPGIE
jgi:hypothetical protein